MSKRTTGLYKDFAQKTFIIESIRSKFELVHSTGALELKDIHQAYAGLYIDLFTEFESFLENLFIGLLSGNYYSNDHNVMRIVKIKPKSIIPEILYSGKHYLDWIPYPDHTINRANRFFNNGLPFTKLDEIQKGRIKDLHKIRNAIAHKSTKSQNDFNVLINNLTLLPSERTPSGYLRSIPNRATGDRQFQIAITDLKQICLLLCT